MTTDRHLLILAARGEESAFSQLYQRYQGRLYAYFRSRSQGGKAAAEDLCQQVFLQLLESRAFKEADKGPDNLSSLLFTIAGNLLKNSYRGEERRKRREDHYHELQRIAQIPEQDYENLRPLLTKAIEQLPDDQKECVSLRFQRGLSIGEISTALSCPPGTVKSRIHYGLKKMAGLVNKPKLFDC